MTFRYKLALATATELVILGAIGQSNAVQQFLISGLPPENNPLASFGHSLIIGLAPFIYCYFPAFLLIAYVAISLLWKAGVRWSGYRPPPYLS